MPSCIESYDGKVFPEPTILEIVGKEVDGEQRGMHQDEGRQVLDVLRVESVVERDSIGQVDPG